MTFDDAFDALIGNEGGYSNNPADPGGETMWGITARVARAWGYTGPMIVLPRETAKLIAHEKYWVPAHCDELPDTMRFEVFDTAYNAGVYEAIAMLQKSLGTTVDGVFGPITAGLLAQVDAEAMRRKFTANRLRFYAALPTWLTFSKGWVLRVADNLEK